VDLGIAGRVAFVAGGSLGMGRATAELFGQEGCRVVVGALERDQESIDETVKAIVGAGGEAVGVAGDLSVKANVERAVGTAREAFGVTPDIVVANIDGPGAGYFDDVSDEDFDQAHRQMTMSMVYLCRAVVPRMKEQRWGRIICMNSMAAKEPPPELAHILANGARAAVVAFNKSLSNEVAEYGITVNTVGTGWFATARMLRYVDHMAAERGVTPEAALAGVEAMMPTRRVGKPEEMAGTIAFLASEYAGFINGEFINVDGGLHRSAF
jgi:NAD(P)-dependent dehydrogenase (short-subunit alcohol dehydrogenase family)